MRRLLVSVLRFAPFAAVVAFCAAAPAYSGEAPTKKEDPAPVAKRFWEWDNSERRDPFEYRSPEVIEDTKETPESIVRVITPTTPIVKTNPKETGSAQQVRKFVTSKAAEARYYLGLKQHTRAEEAMQEAMNKLKGLKAADPNLTERVDRLLLTAQRLKTRAEIEAEFQSVSIEIQGIIWEPTNPMALMKGKAIREGDMVEGALVEEIRTSEIIFNYKGVRCRRQPGR